MNRNVFEYVFSVASDAAINILAVSIEYCICVIIMQVIK